jgi:pyrroloquinoline quinone biosynthesis protein D
MGASAERFCPAERVLTQEATDTLLLLEVDGGMYFSLDGVGRRVWTLCDGTRSVEEVVDVICGEYDAPKEVIDADVRDLLSQLEAERLLSPVAP